MIRRIGALGPLLLAVTTACATLGISDHPRHGAIVQVLDEQAEAWNRGDLEGFMEGYWRSPELVFTSGGRVQRGWWTTLDRYRASYGESAEGMGTLSFRDIEVHGVDDDAAWAMGRWRLERDGGATGGVFTLVFRRIAGEWKIVHDHTSVGPGE